MIRQQHGSTLIVVLILLLAITIIGTLAIRQSMVSLNIATNSQAQQLMIQNSDAATFNVEDTNNLLRSLAADGMFGFIRGPENKGKELVFCYRGSRAQFFTLSQASMVYVNDSGNIVNTDQVVSGFCRTGANNANFFTSERRAVMTQVSVSFTNSVSSTPFQDSVRGTDEELSKIQKTDRVIVNTTSLMPTLASADTDDIDDCLDSHISNSSTNGVANCLSALNVPFTTHVTEYTLGQAFL